MLYYYIIMAFFEPTRMCESVNGVNFHKSTFPHIILCSFFSHNKYIIYYIIILLWRFDEHSRMRGNVEMWILSAFSINRALAITFFGTKLTYINFF